MLFYRTMFVLITIILLFQSNCNGDVAKRLKKRYYDDRMKCETSKKTRPAYECSGLIIRGVSGIHNTLKYAWSLKSGNKIRRSFAAAYLRKDTPFHSFPRGYDTGFIIYPHLETPRKKNKCDVLCAFPLDAHTDARGGSHGCGQSRDDPSGTSRHCDVQGITSFGKWKHHYKSIMHSWNRNFVTRQCGFDMTKRDAAKYFAITLEANSYLLTHSFPFINNEILIRSWNENRPENLPIEAFFYIIDTPGAHNKAKMHQNDFCRKTGEKVPIVGIRLPTNRNLNIHIING